MSIQRISRRRFISGLGAIGGAVILSPSGAVLGLAEQDPCYRLAGKKIRWIVPYSPGGGYDTYSRLIEPFYEKKIGAKIFVDNVTGAGGVVGAETLKESRPDGLTLGMLNAPGLLVTALTGKVKAPNPATDFTVLGRVTRSRRVWATSPLTSFQSIEDVLSTAKKRSIVFGMTDVGGLSFVDVTITSFLMGMDVEIVPGYRGSREVSLAAVRGEIDLIDTNFDTIKNQIEEGDLRPLLQIGFEQIFPHPSLKGVPLLGGDKGLALRRAKEIGRDIEEAREDVRALVDMLGAGRIVAAPHGLDKDLFQCLEEGLHGALTDSAFKETVAASGRSLDVARSDETVAAIQSASKRSEKFVSVVRDAIEKVRR
jgi:tripartite-type tricarboxylate transporter receptor subunit TctC